ncbi:unnamed protein product [Durusdinium trenchii]|uniref:Methyltransf_11 domain-containing protein n=2 Tax=Durusdinium trenchii TaxID=1381693 RepID=A0ABP0LK83_9DINO
MDFLRHKRGGGGHDDLSKCKQIAEAVRGRPTETQVLDVGAGTAPCKPFIRSLGYTYTAQDAMEYAGAEGMAGSVFLHGYADIDVVSDITAMPLPNNSFDVIICTDVLEHVLFPREAVHEIGRLLKRLEEWPFFKFLSEEPSTTYRITTMLVLRICGLRTSRQRLDWTQLGGIISRPWANESNDPCNQRNA